MSVTNLILLRCTLLFPCLIHPRYGFGVFIPTYNAPHCCNSYDYSSSRDDIFTLLLQQSSVTNPSSCFSSLFSHTLSFPPFLFLHFFPASSISGMALKSSSHSMVLPTPKMATNILVVVTAYPTGPPISPTFPAQSLLWSFWLPGMPTGQPLRALGC